MTLLSCASSNRGLTCPVLKSGLIIRRNLDDPAEVKFYFSNAPADIPLIEFVRISGMRWPIEIIFEEAKGEVGFDHYEMRSWLGWHHHMLLVALAHHFLVRLRVRFQHLAPALTVYQVRLLLTSVLPKPVFDAARLCSGFGTTRNGTIRLICRIASPSWPDLLPFQPTLRCNTSNIINAAFRQADCYLSDRK